MQRSQFLRCLRDEAASRIGDLMTSLERGVRDRTLAGGADANALDGRLLIRLRESRQMVEALFPPDTLAMYDEFLRLAEQPGCDLRALSLRIRKLQGVIADAVKSDERGAKRRSWRLSLTFARLPSISPRTAQARGAA